MKTVQKKPEIEFVHYAIQILGFALSVPKLRLAIVGEDLANGGQASPKEIMEQSKNDELITYAVFLRTVVEKMAEIISISKLNSKVIRQRKEIEMWSISIGKKLAASTEESKQ